jgi:hypothetical protein
MVNELLVYGTLFLIAIACAIGIVYYLRLKSLWELASAFEESNTKPKHIETPLSKSTAKEEDQARPVKIKTNKMVRKTSPAQIFADLEKFKKTKSE